MKSYTSYLTFNTKKRKDIIPITNDVERIIRESGVQEALALVSAMHLTASVIIALPHQNHPLSAANSSFHPTLYRSVLPAGSVAHQLRSRRGHSIR